MGSLDLVGNDVVDLDDPAIATHHLRPRFVHRVLDESERAMLARASAPKALLWSLFAAKEAAFKIVAKIEPKTPFAHSRFVVASDLRAVTWGELTLSTRVEVEGAYVHAIASIGSSPVMGAVERTDADPSLAARELLCRSVAHRLGYAARDLEVVRTPIAGSWSGYGPPKLAHCGHPVDADVSLSHDGRFVACAALIHGSHFPVVRFSGRAP